LVWQVCGDIDLSFPYSINHSELGIVLTTAEHVSTLLKIAPKVPGLKVIVSFDELEPEPHRILSEWAKTVDIALKTWKECTFPFFGMLFLVMQG